MTLTDNDIDEPPIIYTPPSRLSKATRAISWIIFILALLARAACLKQLHESTLWGEKPSNVDLYIDWAKRMVAGDWVGAGVFTHSPFYAYFLGLVFRFFGPELLAPRLFQIVAGAATCVLIQRIGRQAFTPMTGLLAGLVAAVYAPWLLQDVMLDKEVFAVLLLCAVIYQLLAADGSQRGLLATAGLCLGLAALVRDGLILMAPVVAVWLMLDPWVRGKMTGGRTREGLSRVGALAVGLMLVVVPVAVRNYNIAGRAVLLTTAIGDLAVISGDASHPAQGLLALMNRDEPLDHEIYERHRALLPILSLPLPSWGWTAPVALAGLILSLARWREALLLYIFGGGYFTTAILFGFARYRMPVVPVMILFAAYGVAEFAAAIRRRRFVRVGIGAVALVAGIVVVNLTT